MSEEIRAFEEWIESKKGGQVMNEKTNPIKVDGFENEEDNLLRKALNIDPFEGDFLDSSDVVLSDKIVKIRKERECSFCKKICSTGSKCRTISAVTDGEIMSYTFCNDCTKEMAMEEKKASER